MLIAIGCAAWAGSAGLTGGPLAYKGPARHDLRPAFGAWGRVPAGKLDITPELLVGWRVRDAIEHRVVLGRVSATLGVGTGSEVVHVGIGLGPALLVRAGSAGEYGFFTGGGGVRALTHFEVKLGRTPLVARYQLGSTTRGILAWDFDALLGLGVAW